MKHTKVDTVFATDTYLLDKEVNRIINEIEYHGGEIVNIQFAIYPQKSFDYYAMIISRC